MEKKVKAVKIAKAAQPVNRIIYEYMVEANKTEMDKQVEEMTMQIEDNTIECKAIIAALETSDLPTAILNKQRKETELVRARTAYEKVRFVSAPLSTCINKRNEAEVNIQRAVNSVAKAQTAIEEVEEQIVKYNSMLKDLQATI